MILFFFDSASDCAQTFCRLHLKKPDPPSTLIQSNCNRKGEVVTAAGNSNDLLQVVFDLGSTSIRSTSIRSTSICGSTSIQSIPGPSLDLLPVLNQQAFNPPVDKQNFFETKQKRYHHPPACLGEINETEDVASLYLFEISKKKNKLS